MTTLLLAAPPTGASFDVVVALAVIMGVATLTTVVFQKLRLPVVLGYLVAGLLVGPHLPVPISADEQVAHTLSELGVILLMYTLGLELSVRKLLKVGLRAFIVAVIETGVLLSAGVAIANALGWSSFESLFVGGLLAISSTTIIVKAFGEQGISGPMADLVFAILVVEDLVAVLIVTVLATVASGSAVSAGSLLVTLGKMAGFLVGTLVAGLIVVPRAMRFVAKLGKVETTVVASMASCFGFALLARAFGYSVALGAFLGGALVAESGLAKEVEPLVLPLRDVFVAVFFVSAGMLIEPAAVWNNVGTILLFSAVLVVGKLMGVTVGGFLAGHGVVPSIRAGMSMGQIGEFSFIIASLGLTYGVVRPELYPIAVAVSALTTLTTPWLIKAAPRVGAFVEGHLPVALATYASLYETWVSQWGSRPRTRTERAQSRRYMIWLLVDLAFLIALSIGGRRYIPRLVSWAESLMGLSPRISSALGVVALSALAAPFVLGAARLTKALALRVALEALPKDGAVDLADAPRRALVASLHLTFLLVVGFPVVAILKPFLPSLPGPTLLIAAAALLTVAVWRSAANLESHVRAGAEVVLETLIEKEVVVEEKAAGPGVSGVVATTRQLLPGVGAVRTVKLASPKVVGRSLRELGVRGKTSATVVALERGRGHVIYPTAEDVLREGDVVVVVGTEAAVAAAAALLQG
jgi:CPA2 family monovalent cation:H+ antiporter-2